MKVACIVPSAGKGKRLGCGQDKPFVTLGGKPILANTLKALESCKFIDDIIIVVSGNKLKACSKLVKKYKFRKIYAIVRGGKKRFDSVKNGLSKIKNASFILIHDGARPFIDRKLIKKVFVAAKKYGAALCATASKQTLKSINRNLFIKETLERKFVWEAQTPQAFKKDLITKAYKKSKNRNATDDSYLVEKLGHRVKIVKGSCRNIKITTPEDLTLARAFKKKGK